MGHPLVPQLLTAQALGTPLGDTRGLRSRVLSPPGRVDWLLWDLFPEKACSAGRGGHEMRSLPCVPLPELGAGLPCTGESQVEAGGLPGSLAKGGCWRRQDGFPGCAVDVATHVATWLLPFLQVPPIPCAWRLPPGAEPGQCLSGQTQPLTHGAPQLGERVAAFGLVY